MYGGSGGRLCHNAISCKIVKKDKLNRRQIIKEKSIKHLNKLLI